MDKRVDIKISFRCNNLCRFCAQGHKRDLYPDRSAKNVVAELKKAYSNGIRGEGASHP